MKEVEVIKHKKNKFDRALGKELSKIRVAPYCSDRNGLSCLLIG